MELLMIQSEKVRSISTLKSLYATFVWSNFEISSILWNAHFLTYISLIEKVQKVFNIFYILSFTYDIPYNVLLNNF